MADPKIIKFNFKTAKYWILGLASILTGIFLIYLITSDSASNQLRRQTWGEVSLIIPPQWTASENRLDGENDDILMVLSPPPAEDPEKRNIAYRTGLFVHLDPPYQSARAMTEALGNEYKTRPVQIGPQTYHLFFIQSDIPFNFFAASRPGNPAVAAVMLMGQDQNALLTLTRSIRGENPEAGEAWDEFQKIQFEDYIRNR